MRNQNVKLITVFFMMFSLFCCAQKPKFTSYSPEEFQKLLNENPAVQLVDVRRPDEFQAGHIDKAVLLNVLDDDFLKKAGTLLDKSKPVAVYCRSGKRSKDAAAKLSKKGFVVFELESGYLGWLDFFNTK
jgi:rhodanese-related sulfurtransferase